MSSPGAARTPAQLRRKRLSRKARRKRAAVLKRDNKTCVYCGATDDPLRIDHRHPVTKGGRSNIENLATACRWCDKHKGAMSEAQWLASPKLANRRAQRERFTPKPDSRKLMRKREWHRKMMALKPDWIVPEGLFDE